MTGFEVAWLAPRRWHVRRHDGLVEGVFTNRRDAMRFVRDESRRRTVPSG